jgi:hypothetical protein
LGRGEIILPDLEVQDAVGIFSGGAPELDGRAVFPARGEATEKVTGPVASTRIRFEDVTA